MLGPVAWTYFYLHVILDIFSRYAVGWIVAHRESAALAERLIDGTCAKHGIRPGQLTVHADRAQDARSCCHGFCHSYNTEHHHTGLLTPAAVHYGEGPAVTAQRQAVLTAAHAFRPSGSCASRQCRRPRATVWLNVRVPLC